ncbi:MAG: hypothetical protein ABSA78_22065 [Candidatus Sulfotelmatobacter sp.]|jgi:VWFA-related protein
MNVSNGLIKAVLGFALCASMCALIPGTLSAQNTAVEGSPAHLLVTVEARHGSDVPELDRRDVMVFEGRDRDQVVDWVPAQGDNAALELFILLDDGSNASLGRQLDDLRKFIDAQPPSVKIGIAYMQNGAARVQQDLTSDHAMAAKALRLPLGIPGINASPYFSLSDLVKHWPASAARREVLMVSDGIDNYYGSRDLDDPYLSAAIDDAQRAGIVVYAIYTPGEGHEGHSYWQSYWGQLYLAHLADDTGGEGYYIGFSGPPVTFSPYLDDMQRHLTHQYILTFNPKPQKKNGWQQVKVTTEVHNAEMVYPRKVYVPAGAH